MRTLLVSAKMLWRRKISNCILVLEMVLSIIMLAQLFVFVSSHIDNMRAVEELNSDNAAVLSIFSYYDTDDVVNRIKQERVIESVGSVTIGSTYCNGRICNLAIYSNAIVNHYVPELYEGKWFTDSSLDPEKKWAVVSRDLGYAIGDSFVIEINNNYREKVIVAGILNEPTQYLYPKGGASPQYFSADLIIDQESVVILQEKDCPVKPMNYIPIEAGIPDNVFVYFHPSQGTEINEVIIRYNRYGEFTMMEELIKNYNKNTKKMIGGGLIFFIVFLFLAITSTLSMNIIQQTYNHKRFTVYYLLGMRKGQMIFVEISRILILELIVMGLTVLSGRYGFLMLDWMTRERITLFYTIAFLMTLLVFISVSVGFWRKMIKNDISQSLVDLQHGE
ncbi:hypothetical protein JS518_15395 [Clostridiales bacterium FE2010]|nr:hypothetical protein JS518_15395 [Clostridiales bacterium FE2010]